MVREDGGLVVQLREDACVGMVREDGGLVMQLREDACVQNKNY